MKFDVGNVSKVYRENFISKKPDQKNGHFTRRPLFINDHIPFDYS